VQNVERAGPQQLIDAAIRFWRPNCAYCRAHLAKLVDTAIVFFQKLYFMAMVAEKSGLSNAALVFPSGDQISVVQHQNPHCILSLIPDCCGRKLADFDSSAR
jgi:hypothetical protein